MEFVTSAGEFRKSTMRHLFAIFAHLLACVTSNNILKHLQQSLRARFFEVFCIQRIVP